MRFAKAYSYDKKTKYGILKNTGELKEMMNANCEPSLNLISKDEDYPFKKYMIQASRYLSGYGDSYKEISFLKIAFNYIPLFRGELLSRYKLFRNVCSKAITVPVNFCIVDPRYDLQYEDMYFLTEENRAISNIYCKKTSESNWTLIKSHKFNLK